MTAIASSPAETTESDKKQLLRIYLRDHEAASVGGLELFRRSTKANHGTPYAAELQRLTNEVKLDRDALRDICGQFDVTFNKVGQALAYAGVTVGRLKTNGRIFSYSPLSRVIELEAMSSGVLSKLRLWESLLRVADADSRLDKAALHRHVVDANNQLDALRRLHEQAIEDAFV